MVQKVNLSMTDDIAEEINAVSVAANAVAGDLAALDASLGTASERNVGDGAGLVPDKAVLDTRLGTTGNLGSAATRAVGVATGNLAEYRQETIELGGDFSPGQEIEIIRIGNLVCISSRSALSHDSGIIASSSGIIPSWATPTVNNRFSIPVMVTAGSQSIFTEVDISETGTFLVGYVDGSASFVSRTSTGGAISISYIV